METTMPRLGDYIRFRVWTREGVRTARRKVIGFIYDCPTVAYRGYRDFVVRPAEILEVCGGAR